MMGVGTSQRWLSQGVVLNLRPCCYSQPYKGAVEHCCNQMVPQTPGLPVLLDMVSHEKPEMDLHLQQHIVVLCWGID